MKEVLQTLPVDHNLFMEYYNGFYQTYPNYNLIDSVSWRWPESDYLELIRYLHKKLGETCTTEAMDWASYRGLILYKTFLISVGVYPRTKSSAIILPELVPTKFLIFFNIPFFSNVSTTPI